MSVATEFYKIDLAVERGLKPVLLCENSIFIDFDCKGDAGQRVPTIRTLRSAEMSVATEFYKIDLAVERV